MRETVRRMKKKFTFRSLLSPAEQSRDAAKELFLNQLLTRLRRVRKLAAQHQADAAYSKLVLVDTVMPVLTGARIPEGLLDAKKKDGSGVQSASVITGTARSALLAESCRCVRSLQLKLDGPFVSAVVQCVVKDSLDCLRFLTPRAALDLLFLLWDVLERPDVSREEEEHAIRSRSNEERAQPGRHTSGNIPFVDAAGRETIILLCDRIVLLWRSSDDAAAPIPQPDPELEALEAKHLHKLVGILFHGDPSARLLLEFCGRCFSVSESQEGRSSAGCAMLAAFGSSSIGDVASVKFANDAVDILRLLNASLGDSLWRSQRADPMRVGTDDGPHARRCMATIGVCLIGAVLPHLHLLRGNHVLTVAASAARFHACCPGMLVRRPSTGGATTVSSTVAVGEIKSSLLSVNAMCLRTIFAAANTKAKVLVAESSATGGEGDQQSRMQARPYCALQVYLESQAVSSLASRPTSTILRLFDFKFASSFVTLGWCFRAIASGSDDHDRLTLFRLYLLGLQCGDFLRFAELKTLLGALSLLREEFSGVDLDDQTRVSMTAVVREVCFRLHTQKQWNFHKDVGAVVSVAIAVSTHALSHCGEFLAMVDAAVPLLPAFSSENALHCFKLTALLSTAVAVVRGTAELEARAVDSLQRLASRSLCSLWKQQLSLSSERRGFSRTAFHFGKYSVWWLKSHALLGLVPPRSLLEVLFDADDEGTTAGVRKRADDAELRLFDLSRTLANLHAPLANSIQEQGHHQEAEWVVVTRLLLCILNDVLLKQVTTALRELLSKAERGLPLVCESLERSVCRSVSQCASLYVCDDRISEVTTLRQLTEATCHKLVHIVELMMTLTQRVLHQVERRPLNVVSLRDSRLPIEVMRIPSQFLSVCLTTEFLLRRASRKIPSSQWECLQPQLERTIRLALDAKSGEGLVVIPREELAEISGQLPFPVALVEDPGPLCSAFSEISVARMMGM